MVSDIAYEIVKLTEILDAEEDKHKEQKEKEYKQSFMMNHLVQLNISFLVVDEDDDTDDEYDYITETFTKYNDEIYWVLGDNYDDNVLRVINIKKNPNILQQICKTANAHYLYEDRYKYRINFNFRESCTFNGNKIMGYDFTGISLYYPKDAEVHVMLNEAFDVIRDFEIV